MYLTNEQAEKLQKHVNMIQQIINEGKCIIPNKLDIKEAINTIVNSTKEAGHIISESLKEISNKSK